MARTGTRLTAGVRAERDTPGGGVVAKKLGLLAIVAAFAVKFAKIGLIAAAGGLVAARKFLARLFNRTTS